MPRAPIKALWIITQIGANKMIPRFVRRFLLISFIIMVAAYAVSFMFVKAQQSLLSIIFGDVAYLALIISIVSLIAAVFVRTVENAFLRRFGVPATAKVLATKWTNETASSGGRVYRLKLEVHPSSGEPFIAVAEDAFLYNISDYDEGNTVPVKYDPRTKDVVLMMPKKTKIKEEDF
jgi:hypothetical protein